ncbi:Ff.00g078640.m01.CDS01 [Fusarium sp. VM40]|nr:Ff.00g078640.m01.CDS01 [Fusarium sp. VM40]
MKIFPHAIELSRVTDKMAWVPGQMLGEPDAETKAPISISQEFIFPGDNTDTRSSTSRGHQIHHKRPPGVGAGWGGYDEFYEWQGNGRTINKDWVKPGNWENSEASRITFSNDNGEVDVAHYTDAEIEKIQSKSANSRSLHTKLRNRGTGYVQQSARRGRGNVRGGKGARGARGGRGGITSYW